MVAPYPYPHLPDHTQLPESDGTFVKNFAEHPQSLLLTDALKPRLDALHPDGHYCIGQDCGIYWRQAMPPEPPERGAVSPDWFYVSEVPPLLDGRYRRSYVMWQEHVAPLLVLEFVSGDGTEERDKTPGRGKFWIYERVIRPPYYGIYEVASGRVEVYQMAIDRYRLARTNAHGHFAIEPLGVALGIWQGSYLGMELPWLRWYDQQGLLLPLSEERAQWAQERVAQVEQEAQQQRQRAAEAEQQAQQADLRAMHAEQQADQERQKTAALAERLRALGIDPGAL
ncbi:Uma2 family endonuclease [Gloeobacter morelensis]|uniref:Uma2 family endonuclease n=1 Tax=Gloeobacter morelensis MG652769 TaxID=2781736 RepID=A0ABY3PN63_9CYAN|nr:Uma2 family endonuclease [Gloeobacter morelensis]UFP95009.1 Uma2 family endonuclease [Gloeobacter morelensis MG652769]